MSIIAALQLAVAATSLIGGCVILLRRRRGALALGLMLVLLGTHVAVLWAQELGRIGWHVTVAHLFGLLYGPLFYAYLRGALFAEPPAPWRALAHTVPLLVFAVALASGRLSGEALAFAVFASFGTYLALALVQLNSYQRVLEATRSSIPTAQLSWLRFTTAGLALVYVLDVAAFVAPRLFPDTTESSHAALLYLVMLAYLWALLLTALWRPQWLAPVTPEEMLAAVPEAAPAEQGAQDGAELRRIDAHMRAARPYLQPELKLAALAQALGLTPRRLSALINRGRGRNFSDWVNAYRIEEAQRLLAADGLRHDSVLEVMYRAGFNSKSTFNAVFKRATGTTPSEFVGLHGPKAGVLKK
jgi:AraC-like DNA-binding protein